MIFGQDSFVKHYFNGVLRTWYEGGVQWDMQIMDWFDSTD